MTKLRVLLDPRQRRRTVLVLAGLLCAALLEMLGIGAIPGFVALLADPGRLLRALPDGHLSAWVRAMDLRVLTLLGAGLLAAIFLVKNAFIAFLTIAEGRLVRDVTSAASTRLFQAYLHVPYTFHLQRNPAELIRNVSSEVIQAVGLLSNAMIVTREGLVLIVVFVLLLSLDPVISLLMFALLGTAAGLFYVAVRRSLTKRGRLAQIHRGRQLQTVNQGLGAIRDAKILGREPYLVELFSREAQGIQHHGYFQRVVAALPRLFLEVLGVAAILLVAVTYVLLGRSLESMLPVLALLAVGTVRLVPAFNAIAGAMAQARYQRPSLDLVAAELETLERETPAPAPGAAQGTEPAGFEFHREIRLHDVRYRYPGAVADALQGVSVRIGAGETVGFIGPSGAGKSTLVDLVLGLLSPTSGEVRVDGRNIEDNLPGWQRRIGYIPQDIYLIDDSIRRNVAFGLPDGQIDEAALHKALEAAQIDTFVKTLPQGVETVVGDRGIRLSGGQRQRIGIARALYHNPSVLVMDEATSALDNETEREVVAAIADLRGDHTVVIIAHRLTTVAGCDRLYLLENGQVEDQGTSSELAGRHERLKLLLPEDDRKLGTG